jgi:hypothetical protein
MPNPSAATNVHHFMRKFPAHQPPDASDPVPVMRREITLLRIEVEHLRAMEAEARKAKELLLAYVVRVEHLRENRDQWQREAERLVLLTQVHEGAFEKPHWSGWRKRRRLESLPELAVTARAEPPCCWAADGGRSRALSRIGGILGGFLATKAGTLAPRVQISVSRSRSRM